MSQPSGQAELSALLEQLLDAWENEVVEFKERACFARCGIAELSTTRARAANRFGSCSSECSYNFVTPITVRGVFAARCL